MRHFLNTRIRYFRQRPVLRALEIVVLTSLVPLVIVAVTALPFPIDVKSSLVLLGVGIPATWLAYIGYRWWRSKEIEWETLARRRVIASLIVVGTTLALRGLAGTTLSHTGFRAEFNFADKEHYQLVTQFVITLLAGNAPEVDIACVLLGVLILFACWYFLIRQPGQFGPQQNGNRASKTAPRQSISRPISRPSAHPFHASSDYDVNLPPLVEYWVGRKNELVSFSEKATNVFAVTGIGGQGKSALAAKAMEQVTRDNPGLFWDWRDCREESDRFRTQLLLVIGHIADRSLDISEFGDTDVAWLSQYFFRYLAKEEGIIVFDNVDNYVDLDKGIFAREVSQFIHEALRVDHNLTIVFTCRPRISYASTRFREIHLRGLDVDEAEALFRQRLGDTFDRHVGVSLKEFHQYTAGHPLWLNMVASQIKRRPEHAEAILNDLREGLSDDQAVAVLRSIWTTLHRREKYILRCMAEIRRPLASEEIHVFTRAQVATYNRFDRAFRALKSISLVTEKRASGTSFSRFDLHPLVTSFIRKEYVNNRERASLLGKLVQICDTRSKDLKERGQSGATVAYLENRVTRTELSINCGDMDAAIRTLGDIVESLQMRGFHEELIRLGCMILNVTNWKSSPWAKSDSFHELSIGVIKQLVELGKAEEARSYAQEYMNALPHRGARFIDACELLAYVEWFDGNLDGAVKIAQRGVDLKRSSGIDTFSDCEHVLALAKRDGGDAKAALEYFRLGQPVEAILRDDHRSSGRDASYYGNVGRCLYLSGNLQGALRCYLKSYDLLSEEDAGVTMLNRGYACLWISEILETWGSIDECYRFLKLAELYWRKRAPARAYKLGDKLNQLHSRLDQCIKTLDDSQIELECRTWIAEELEKINQSAETMKIFSD